MSLHSIHQYHIELEKLKDFSGTAKETAIRSAFYNLSKWVKQMMNLHVNYESVEPYPLCVVNDKGINPLVKTKPKLKANKQASYIILDKQNEMKYI